MSFFKGTATEKQKQVTDFLNLLTEAYFGDGDRAKDQLPMARKKIMAYISEPAKIGREAEKKKIEAFTASSDFPQMVTSNFDSFLNTDEYDMAWEAAFREVTLEPGRLSWEILNVNSGLTFNEVPEGAHIKIDALSGERVTIHCKKYGGGIGWSIELLMGRQWSAMEDIARDFRESFWSDKANRHYALLGAAANASGTSWASTTVATTDPLYQLTRDISTLESAAYTLTNRIKDKGYGDVANTPIIGYFPVFLRSRILRALAYTGQDIGGAPVRVTYPITPRFTYNSYLTSTSGASATTDALLVVPGKRLQRATAMEPTNFMKKDIQSLTDIQTVWSFYGAGSGFETGYEQVQKASFA